MAQEDQPNQVNQPSQQSQPNQPSERHLEALKPDHLSPAHTEKKAEDIAVTKTQMATARCFVSAMLAGAFIAFGANYFLVFLGDASMPFGAQRLVGGLVFCTGLVLVLCCGAELFTGNCLMVCGKLSNRIAWSGMLKNWLVVWLGNLAGALVIVLIVWGTNEAAMAGGGVGEAMVSVAASKVTPEWMALFFKGILCNVLVCLAVWIGFAARTIADKVLGIILPISAFVACGFEHCVANMFFLPMGCIMHSLGFGAEVAGADLLNFGGIFYNLSAATLGNIVGGALFVGVAYWFIYHPKTREGGKTT